MSNYVNQRIAEIRAEAAERDAAFRAAMEAAPTLQPSIVETAVLRNSRDADTLAAAIRK